MDRNLRLLTLGVGVRTFGNALYFPFLALFLYNVLHVGYVQIALIVVLVGIIQVPFSVVGGLLTDRLGRRPLVLIGLAAEAVSTAALGYEFSLHSLLGAIVAATLGGAVTTASGPAFSAYIADFTKDSERTRGFTWFRIGFNAGYSVGVSLGGFVVVYAGYSGVVEIASVVIGSATILLTLTLAPSPFDLRRSRGRSPETPRTPPELPPRARTSMRESLSRFVADRIALEVAIAFTLATFIGGQWAVIFPLYVHNVLGIGYTLLGVGLALNGVIVVFGQNATTERVIGMKHTTIAILGLGLYALAFLTLGASGLLGFFPSIFFLVAVAILTLGENLVTIPGATLPSNIAPAEEVGSYNGIFQTLGNVGFLLAILLGGSVLAWTSDPLLIWVILVLPGIPAVILLRHAGSRIPARANTA